MKFVHLKNSEDKEVLNLLVNRITCILEDKQDNNIGVSFEGQRVTTNEVMIKKGVFCCENYDFDQLTAILKKYIDKYLLLTHKEGRVFVNKNKICAIYQLPQDVIKNTEHKTILQLSCRLMLVVREKHADILKLLEKDDKNEPSSIDA